MHSLSEIEKYVKKNFSYFGVNKKDQITRLLFEINKKDRISFKELAASFEGKDFDFVKKKLLDIRYPQTSHLIDTNRYYLPRLNLKTDYEAMIKTNLPKPKKIYIEIQE